MQFMKDSKERATVVSHVSHKYEEQQKRYVDSIQSFLSPSRVRSQESFIET